MSHGMDTGGPWPAPPPRYGWSPPPGPAQGEMLRYAGWWRRVGASAVDGVFGVVLLVPGAVYFVAGPSELVNCEGLNILEASPGMCDRPTEDTFGTSVLLWLLGLVAFLVYRSVLEGSPGGATLGKRVVGIRVADAVTGAPISRPRAAGRLLVLPVIAVVGFCLLIPLDLLWPLWDRQNQTLHDKVTSTVVLRI
jgi:uncharacterized RDD family membrane protein YckC